MEIIPAIDLKDNKCVRLSEGKDETSIVFNKEPEKQAAYFENIGCKKIHIVDLDAAFGRPNINLPSINKIRKSVSIPIQLGGGIRTKSVVEQYFSLGINYLIIGSMSVKNPDTVIELSETYQNKIYISLDIKKNNIMVKGWNEKSKLDIEDFIKLYEETKVRGFVITDIENDGMLKGLDTIFIKEITKKIEKNNNLNKKLIIAGGLTNYSDLRNLKKMNLKNIDGVVSGKSFYVGNIDLIKAQEILDSDV